MHAIAKYYFNLNNTKCIIMSIFNFIIKITRRKIARRVKKRFIDKYIFGYLSIHSAHSATLGNRCFGLRYIGNKALCGKQGRGD